MLQTGVTDETEIRSLIRLRGAKEAHSTQQHPEPGDRDGNTRTPNKSQSYSAPPTELHCTFLDCVRKPKLTRIGGEHAN